MTTIKKEVKIVGNGLMKNKPCEVTLFPSKSGQIRYFVKDKDSTAEKPVFNRIVGLKDSFKPKNN